MSVKAKITEFIFDNGEYFVALTDDGGARIGMNDVFAYDVPANHRLFDEITKLIPGTVEAFIDAQIENGNIDIRVFSRI